MDPTLPAEAPERTPAPSGARFVRTSAYVVIVVAGLKAAGDLILPLLLAALLSLACIPATRRLQRLGLPNALSIVVVVLVVLLLLLVLSGVVGGSVRAFTSSLPLYEARLNELIDQSWLEKLDLTRANQDLSDLIDTGAAMKFVASITNGVVAALSNAVLILLIMIFILLEANGFGSKLRRAFGRADADLSRFREVTDQVYGYLSIKTSMSLLTGATVTVLTAAVGVDFPVLWGLVAFLLNFVPNVGSILAALPPVLLALIQFGWGSAAIVAGGYVAINMVIGNVVEPRVMGRRLGLSPLVVILSLIFWSWVWGPVGMVLSLPLTMVVKIMLENSEDFRFAAVLLGPADE